MREPLSKLEAWRVFEAVARTGSLSRAAIELDMSVSKTSRTLARLEAQLGEALFVRASRPLKPTPLAAAALQRLQALLPAWREFEDFVQASAGLRRVVRLSTPAGIGRFYLNEQIAQYRKIDPALVIEAFVDEDVEALLHRTIDVAFLPYTPEARQWEGQGGALAVYPAMRGFTVPLASPAYLRTRARPRTPQDLKRHTLILKTGGKFPTATHLVCRGQRQPVRFEHVVLHHDMLNIKDAALRGFGIALDIPLGMVLEELREKSLVPVLDGWHRDYWNYSIVTRSESGPHTDIGRFAAWYAKRATEEINSRRDEGFRILGIDPAQI